jgi:hypothetical protein
LDYTPCGAIANSKFNGLFFSEFIIIRKILFSFGELDTLTLSFNGNQTVPVTNLGIAWTTDKAVKFQNPTNDSKTCKYERFLFVFFYKR